MRKTYAIDKMTRCRMNGIRLQLCAGTWYFGRRSMIQRSLFRSAAISGGILLAIGFAALAVGGNGGLFFLRGQTPSLCGNGAINTGEQCDDQDADSGDGCSSSCQVERGYRCRGVPSVCSGFCGNGIVESGEQCDTGAVSFGCTSACTVIYGFACTGTRPSVCQRTAVNSSTCGNGVREGKEGCDDGNTITYDGCTGCQVDTGFACTGSPSVCRNIHGDGILDLTERCDDGNRVNGDGCNSVGVIEAGYACSGTPSQCLNTCGNGSINIGEECDDSDIVSNDGCDSTCRVEVGSLCTGNPSLCHSVCSNGVLDYNEECDDGNSRMGDACYRCYLQAGWTCEGEPSICTGICGDGMVRGSEQCDDENELAGDGCNQCSLEPGWSCTGGTCVFCGNGIKEGVEKCDDNNTASNDGCSSACIIETGWTCNGWPSVCQKCGNGIKEGTESCDDGDAQSGDGCSALCKVESYWICTGDHPTTCTKCGNGRKDTGEECDDGNAVARDGCSPLCRKETVGSTCWNSNDCQSDLLCSTEYGDCFSSSCPAGRNCETVCSGKCIQPKPVACGNGRVEDSEECDDKNTTNGDGCDSACFIEECGDGRVRGVETCDDGDTDNGDGCNSSCAIESGWGCVGSPSNCFLSTLSLSSSSSSATTALMQCLRMPDQTACGPQCELLDASTCQIRCTATCNTVDGFLPVSVRVEGPSQLPLTASSAEYTLSITNNSASVLDELQLVDYYNYVLDGVGLRFVSAASDARCGGANANQGVLECNVPTLQPFASESFRITYQPVFPALVCRQGVGGGAFNQYIKYLYQAQYGGAEIMLYTAYRCPTSSSSTVSHGVSSFSSAPRCGDGFITSTERCDDGNTANSDGCSSTCTVESGWSCSGVPSVCTTLCGDGIKAGAEACDDGNLISKDGCSNICQLETLSSSSSSTSSSLSQSSSVASARPICGNNRLETGEQCERGVAGCSTGYSCNYDLCQCVRTSSSSASSHSSVSSGLSLAAVSSASAPVCGNGVLEGEEQCDRGLPCISPQFCSTLCQCLTLGSSSALSVALLPSSSSNSAVSLCGNGTFDANEQCDLGFACPDGGVCSQFCTCPVTVASSEVSSVPSLCGDGLVEDPEQCDDGNLLPFDGCSFSCTFESGYSCFGVPSACFPSCGDGIRIPPEQCDDGNLLDGDGCSSVCEMEYGAAESSSDRTDVSASSASFVMTVLCGNGLTEEGEECDDGNLFDQDGCSHLCTVETFFVSSSESSISSLSSISFISSSSSVLPLPEPLETTTSSPWWMWLLIVLLLLIVFGLVLWIVKQRKQAES
ncbi:MAG: DUF4215 domain-containing protein [Candidatus Peribacteraceae bacterium]|nr:DUF4215 domain-containing protein [Candidatus Peribacteraceae bacterium]